MDNFIDKLAQKFNAQELIQDGGHEHFGTQTGEGGAADRRGHDTGTYTNLQAVNDLFRGKRLLHKELLAVLLSSIGNGLYQLIIILVQRLFQVSKNI